MLRLLTTSALTLAIAIPVAGPLAAQDTVCGPDIASGQWISDAADTSDIATADTYAEQMALVLNGNEYIALFSLSADADIRIEAAARGNGDAVLRVLDASGTEVATDDDSGGNGAARIETPLSAGTYCAIVRSFDDSPMTAFVRVGLTEMEALTPGMDAAQMPADLVQGCTDATDLGVLGATALRSSSSAADQPFASFTLNAATAISITAVNSDADPTLKLINADGEILSENDDSDGLNSRISQTTPLAAGTYCVNVGAISNETLPIDLTVSLYDSSAAMQGLYDSGEAAPPLDGSIPVTDLGLIANRLRQDVDTSSAATWFNLDIDAPGLLLIEALSVAGSGDPWLVMFDDLGRQVAQNDDANNGTDAMITVRVTPGSYLVGVRQVQDQSAFVRLVIERYIPAP